MNLVSCPPELWPEFSRLLDEALDLPDAERAAWLARVRDAHSELAPWLERVLSRRAAIADYLQRPHLTTTMQSDVQAGQRIGPYTLVREIGSGGMGMVWLAERSDGQLRREIALKLPHAHLLAGKVGERFARERDILAALNHPHIATLFDAGLGENGRPYMALEYVEGQPITDWCRLHKATLDQRIDLMRQVMEAVQYAHAHLIVHRDLKPSNVLVTSDGWVKLLDFGIAKLLLGDTDLESIQALTREGERIATPGYATPEQLQGAAITTKVDIYTLGVMLYELFCGERPLAPAANDAQAANRHRTDLPLCSTRVNDAFANTVAGANAGALRRQLRGDLDAILSKALQTDPEARYASVEAFAADLECYRLHRPISAQRIGRLTLAAKFIRRHRTGAAMTALFLAALIAALSAALWQAQVARQQASFALEQAEHARAVREFLVGVFEQADPNQNKGQPISAHQLLEKGEMQLSAAQASAPSIQADLTGLIGDLYWKLGDFDRAMPLLKRAAGMVANPQVPDEIKARCLRWLAGVEKEKSDFKSAKEHARQAVEFAGRAGKPGYDDASEARRILAYAETYDGEPKAAIALLNEALVQDRMVYGSPSKAVADDMVVFGHALDEDGNFDGAAEALREAVRLSRAAYGDTHSQVADAYNALGLALGHKYDLAAAEVALREALEICTKIYPPGHQEILIAQSVLFSVMEKQGHYADALAGRLILLEAQKKFSEMRPEALAQAYLYIGFDYLGLNRLSEAEAAIRQSLALWAKVQGSNREESSVDSMIFFGIVLQLQGRFAEAEAVLRDAISIQLKHEAPTSEWLGKSRNALGSVLRMQHRYDEAIQLLTDEIAALRSSGRGSSMQSAEIEARLAETKVDVGAFVDAQSLATKSLASMRKLLVPGHLRLSLALLPLARAQLALGQPGDALPLFQEALDVRRSSSSPTDLRNLEIKTGLVNALEAMGKTADAHAIRLEVEPVLAAMSHPYAADLHKRLAPPASQEIKP